MTTMMPNNVDDIDNVDQADDFDAVDDDKDDVDGLHLGRGWVVEADEAKALALVGRPVY